MVYNGFGSFVSTPVQARDDRMQQHAEDYYDPSTSDVVKSFVSKFLSNEGLFGSLSDARDYGNAQYGEIEGLNHLYAMEMMADFKEPDTPILSKEDFEKKGYHPSVDYMEGMRQGAAEVLDARQREIDYTDQVIDNASASQKTLGFIAGLGSAFADPFNVMFSFVPVPFVAGRIGGLVANASTKSSRLGARVVQGSTSGAFGAAVAEPAYYGLVTGLGDDYTYADSLSNILVSAVVGAGLQGVGGAVVDRLNGVDIKTKETATLTALRQVVEGNRVDVEPIINSGAKPSLISSDPFDPNFVFRDGVWKASKPFDIGAPSGKGQGTRYKDYKPVKGADAKWLENTVYELEHSQGGDLTFNYNADAPGSTVISNPGNVPEWFQTYNAEATKANRKRKIQQSKNRRAGRDDSNLPPTEPILTRAVIRKVAEKLQKGEPLGKHEAKVAEVVMQASRDAREAQIRAMVDNRQDREARRFLENDEIAKREEELDALSERNRSAESSRAADPEMSDRIMEDNFPDDYDEIYLQRHVEELEAELKDLGVEDLDDIGDFELKVDNYSEAVRLGSACMRKS